MFIKVLDLGFSYKCPELVVGHRNKTQAQYYDKQEWHTYVSSPKRHKVRREGRQLRCDKHTLR